MTDDKWNEVCQELENLGRKHDADTLLKMQTDKTIAAIVAPSKSKTNTCVGS